MPTLIIDTSTERGVVGVVDKDKILSQQELVFGYNHSKDLLCHIETAMQDAGIDPQDLSHVTVTLGPGSYTGLRVGVAAAQCLAFAWEIPVVGVCSLLGFVPEEKKSFLAVIDAKISGVYLLKDGEHMVCSLEQLQNMIQDVECVVSPNIEAWKKRIPEITVPCYDRYPSLEALSKHSYEKFFRKDYGKLELMYLRKTQAEIERDEKREICG